MDVTDLPDTQCEVIAALLGEGPVTGGFIGALRTSYTGRKIMTHEEFMLAFGHPTVDQQRRLLLLFPQYFDKSVRARQCDCAVCLFVRRTARNIPSVSSHDFFTRGLARGTEWSVDFTRRYDPDIFGNVIALVTMETQHKFTRVSPMKQKTAVWDAFADLLEWGRRHGFMITRILCDMDTMWATQHGETIFTRECQNFMRTHNVQFVIAGPYSQSLNPVESHMRSLVFLTHQQLFVAHLSLKLVFSSLISASDIANQKPYPKSKLPALKNSTPERALLGRQSNPTQNKPWGAAVGASSSSTMTMIPVQDRGLPPRFPRQRRRRLRAPLVKPGCPRRVHGGRRLRVVILPLDLRTRVSGC